MLGRDTMSDGGAVLPWLVIRQDDNGNRYRVGRYATQAEAQKIADKLDSRGHKQLYWVERLGQGARPRPPSSTAASGSGPPVARERAGRSVAGRGLRSGV